MCIYSVGSLPSTNSTDKSVTGDCEANSGCCNLSLFFVLHSFSSKLRREEVDQLRREVDQLKTKLSEF